MFLADVPRLSDRAAVKLDQFAKAGGTVVLLPGDSTDVSALARLEFLPATALRARDLPGGRLSSEIIDPGHPLFANTWGPGTPFPPLPQHRLIEWKSRANLQMLVTAGGTEGFVMACDDGAGRVYSRQRVAGPGVGRLSAVTGVSAAGATDRAAIERAGRRGR